MRIASALTLALMSMTLSTGCPIPVQYPLVPDAGNEPPVVNPDYTVPYVVMEDPVEEQGLPQFTLVVDDPNPDDILEVKVLKELDLSWLPADPTVPHQELVFDQYIDNSWMVTAEDASNMGVPETTRSYPIDLQITPCDTDDVGERVFLWVCVTDDVFAAPPVGHPNENPCISRDGYVDTYPVMVQCIAAQ